MSTQEDCTRVTLASLVRALPIFEERLTVLLKELGIFPVSLPIDHLAVRLATASQTAALAQELAPYCVGDTWISCKQIHGRKIYVFHLREPFNVLGQQVSFLEVPYPKVGRDYSQVGWEHIEFTLRPRSMTNHALHRLTETEALAAFKREFDAVFPKHIIPAQVKFTADSRQTSDEDLPNLLLTFEKSPDLLVRFHPRTIEEVVKNLCV